MKHLGDITKINGANVPPVNVVIGGSPCQDLSVAGRRKGLKGERSGLFMEQIRIIKEMREKSAQNGSADIKPRYMVWENVPGAFSSNKGQDFKAVLEETIKIVEKNCPDIPIPDGGWHYSGAIMGNGFSVAWRVFDAQFWGVPQHRRRIALVADFGGQSAPEILFERKSVSGDITQSLRAWQETACRGGKGSPAPSLCLNAFATDVHAAGFCTEHSAKARSVGFEEDKSPTLRAGTVPAAVYENHSQDTRYTGPIDVSPTVSSTYGMGGNNQPFVVETPKTLKIRSSCDGGGKGALVQDDKSATLSCNNDQTLFEPKVYGICSKNSNSMKSDNPDSGIYEAETARTLDTSNQSPDKNQGGMAVVAVQGSMIGRKPENGPQGSGINEDVSFTLDAVDRHAVAYGIDRATYNMGQNAKFNIAVEEDIEPTMVAKGPGAVGQPIYHSSKNSFHTDFSDRAATDTLVATDFKDPPTVSKEPDYIVRRLTPLECERLQGFPDGWTDIGDYIDTKGKKRKTSDSARYKALGNSIALPSWVWVLDRLSKQCTSNKTMASLFDGIGGFPLIWETLNGEGTCLWASEIEEYPIAVTKYHFNKGG